MEYYIAKGKRRREERAAALSKKTYQTSSQLTDTKSLEASTLNNTLITNNTSYDDSDDELGAEIYRSSLTAKRHLKEQKQAMSMASTQTTTRRNSSRLLHIKSKEDAKKGSIMCSKATSTDNEKIAKKIIGSNKRKAAAVLADDEIEVTGDIKRVYRNGRYRRLCSSTGCSNFAINGGVCTTHGAVVKSKKYTCNHIECNNYAQRGGVCIKHGAVVKRRKICSHEGCPNKVVKEGVCKRHGAKVKTCSHKGCNNQARKGGVCARHGTADQKYACTAKGCTSGE